MEYKRFEGFHHQFCLSPLEGSQNPAFHFSGRSNGCFIVLAEDKVTDDYLEIRFLFRDVTMFVSGTLYEFLFVHFTLKKQLKVFSIKLCSI